MPNAPRPARSVDPASGPRTGGALRRVGGRARWRALCSRTRRFRGVVRMVVCPMTPCRPGKLNRVPRTAGPSLIPSLRAIRPNAPTSRSLRAIRPADRGPAMRCGGWGEGGCEECWARARIRGVSGVGLKVVRDPRTGPVPEKLSRASHTAGPLRISCDSPVPSLRAIRPADRGPAVRCGGWGEGRGECWARARLRGFSGGLAHMV